MTSKSLSALLVGIVLVITALPSAAAGKPLRSGTILTGSGWFVESWVGGCQMAPECQAWIQSDCAPELTGREPALTASIENVSELADGRTRRPFRFGRAAPAGLVWGAVVVQLWRKNCTEIRGARWRSSDCDPSGGLCRSTRLLLPRSAEWMTVTSTPDNVNILWVLR